MVGEWPMIHIQLPQTGIPSKSSQSLNKLWAMLGQLNLMKGQDEPAGRLEMGEGFDTQRTSLAWERYYRYWISFGRILFDHLGWSNGGNDYLDGFCPTHASIFDSKESVVSGTLVTLVMHIFRKWNDTQFLCMDSSGTPSLIELTAQEQFGKQFNKINRQQVGSE